MITKWIVLVFLFIAQPTFAQIYKWTDSQGNVHFSDKPQPGAEKVELPSVQTYTLKMYYLQLKTLKIQVWKTHPFMKEYNLSNLKIRSP